MSSPLSHIRVLELSRILAGPWAGQMLADLGAEVIKVEKPIQGDDTRHWGPPYLNNRQGEAPTESAYFLSANRGKRSITIDIRQPEGQAIIHRLIESCDVLIENFKVGSLQKYYLDYASLSAINPQLIYCSITGFGQDGPYAQRAGYDFLLQGMGGLMSVTGEPDHLPGGGPQKVGVALTDILTGMYATTAIQAAIIEREKSGLGQHIDLALLDVQVACLANQAMNYLVSQETPKRMGNAHPNIVPYQTFETADGFIILTIGNDSQFADFCEVAQCQTLIHDPDFATNQSRVRNRDVVIERLTNIIKAKDSEFWLQQLEIKGVPCGPINDIAQVFENPQIKHRKMLGELTHPENGKVPTVANPINFSRTPIAYNQAPPKLGEHTDKVLSELLSYDSNAISKLRHTKII
ncbi:CaiB/BaiF CoA-transferase family protein [uncultured Paraglaciecola sp.]|jgi:crotonobetainyl-CoA:carnitine CoA-transferase CaiB-like acyl-CoA transferase|uniref:CaiB/BaiF CoA transferase family protein n=1 Tax=uncultured Paraglaciecola sp. TaxID=1765024 RepID=UPI0025D59D24|nr:CaiB/BaiF CoA-transferase family protein [uncultured Paraglaciecola sp.]